MSGRPFLCVRGARLVGGGSAIATIESLEAGPGDLLVIQGESGSGKTSLLRAMTGADPDAQLVGGELVIAGRDPRELDGRDGPRFRRDTIGLLPQTASSTFEPMRALDRQFGIDGSDLDSLCDWLERLDGVGDPASVARLLRRRPFAVSGGQAQRVAMAAVLARGRPLRLLDEPTVGLDRERWSLLRDVLVDSPGSLPGGVTILATHDREIARELEARASARILHIAGGSLRDGPPPAVASPPAPPAPADGEPCLKVERLQVVPGHRADPTPPLDLELHPGRITALLGSSGLGKSTVARALAGFLKPCSGRIDFPGRVEGPAGVHLVPQDALASMPAGRTVASVLGEVVEHGRLAGAVSLDSVRTQLAELELPAALWDQRVDALSGGELRRVAILRGLASAAPILIVDEPTAGLDPRRAGLVIAFLQRIAQTRGMAMLWITHDRELAGRSAHQVIEWGES